MSNFDENLTINLRRTGLDFRIYANSQVHGGEAAIRETAAGRPPPSAGHAKKIAEDV